MTRLPALVLVLSLVACAPPAAAPNASPTVPAPSTPSAASPTPTTSPSPAGGAVPKIPDPVAVQLAVKGSALLVLDITTAVCTPRPSCVASLSKVAGLLKKARDAKVPVIYSLTPTAGSTVLPEVAPQVGEPSVTTRADKFYQTNLDQLLKDHGVQTAVIVGSASNGAVLYTAFSANLRGYTVVVAQDGISAEPEFATTLTRYQLLNQPGFANADNKPLDPMHVTLSTTDLITFK